MVLPGLCDSCMCRDLYGRAQRLNGIAGTFFSSA